MTGKRKSGRKSGSSSKKETPEKTRRSSRRRGHKKSDSEDDSGSEQSVDGREERMETPKKEDLSKEDESGGSDGAWQVRSENGNKGGIPKLKISLHRPAETSSPTPEPLSSPKPRRSRRGAANEEASEDGDDAAATGRDTVSETSENEGERRSSKSRKRRDKEGEHSKDTSVESSEDGNAADEKDELEREAERKAQEEAARLEQERKLEEERKIEIENQRKIKEEEEAEARKKAEEEEKERQQEKERLAKQEVEREKEARRKSLEEKEKEARRKSLEKKEKEARRKSLEEKEKEARRKSLEEKEREARKKEREEKEREAKRKAEEEEAGRKEKEETARAKSEGKEEPSKLVAGEEHGEKGSDAAKVEEVVSESIDAGGEKVDSDVEVVASRTSEERPGRRRSRRTPSRDSSEERAKQAALASRKPKETAESEDGEVPDSPEREVSFPVRTEGKIRTSASTPGSTTKENQDQPVVRKRRWGSSNSNQSAKKPLSISTDVLKEIIPEVKPVALSEVELTLQKEEIVLDDDKPVENRSSKPEENARTNVRSRRRRDVSSDESEKDYEEEAVDSDGEEMVKKKPPPANHMEVEEEAKEEVKETSVAMPVRKALPADPLEAFSKQRSPSPARHPVSNILFITNLVRPFTVVQLRDLLARTGTIAEEKGFWIDTIKSKCYVKYTSEEDAKNTRHALHGVRWPVSNPKQLNVDFSTEAAMSNALEGGRPVAGDADRHAAIEERLKRDREREVREKERRARDVKEPVAGRLGDLENGREVRRVSDRERERERDRETRDREGDRERRDEKPMRTVRKVTTMPVREWDLGKAERGFSPPTDDNRRFAEVGRKRDQDRQRSLSLEPQKKSRRRDELSPPKKILDDLFRKTKTTPCIYWLPLSEQQIAEKETQRRKHMEEHEKRIVEERKRREAKRRRSRSRSPKK